MLETTGKNRNGKRSDATLLWAGAAERELTSWWRTGTHLWVVSTGRHTDDAVLNCALGTYKMWLTNVTPVNSIKKKKKRWSQCLSPDLNTWLSYLIWRERHGPQSPIVSIYRLQQTSWGQVIELQLSCLRKTQRSPGLRMTPATPKVHAYTPKWTSNEQQRRGRLLRKQAPRLRLWASHQNQWLLGLPRLPCRVEPGGASGCNNATARPCRTGVLSLSLVPQLPKGNIKATSKSEQMAWPTLPRPVLVSFTTGPRQRNNSLPMMPAGQRTSKNSQKHREQAALLLKTPRVPCVTRMARMAARPAHTPRTADGVHGGRAESRGCLVPTQRPLGNSSLWVCFSSVRWSSYHQTPWAAVGTNWDSAEMAQRGRPAGAGVQSHGVFTATCKMLSPGHTADGHSVKEWMENKGHF